MKKTLSIIFFFCVTFSFSQIEIKISTVDSSCKNNCELKISILNNSKIDYVIPIDTTGLRVYDNEIYWLNFVDSENNSKSLSLISLIKDNKQNNNLEAITNRGEALEINFFDLQEFKVLSKNLEYKMKKHETEVKKWQKLTKIRNFKEAEKNKYLNSNLLFLNASQEYNFQVLMKNVIDLEDSPFSPSSYYPIGPGEKYLYRLRLDVPERIKAYFVKKQLKELKNFTVFSGIVESNEIEVDFDMFIN